MQDGIQDGSQDIKHVFMYFSLVFPVLNFISLTSFIDNILGIHLCIMSVQSNFDHNPLNAKSLDVVVKLAK